jgi:broad specificity phosphatase PhoE
LGSYDILRSGNHRRIIFSRFQEIKDSSTDLDLLKSVAFVQEKVIWITQKSGKIIREESKIMTSIYLVRHGQTAWNREEIFRGRTDVPLDESGRKQAELVGQYFEEMKIHAIYSSPLARAWETAQAIARFHTLKVEPLEAMIDMSFGNWEGHAHQEIREIDGETYRQWVESPHLARLPGGESLDDVRARSMTALEALVRNDPGKTLVLVSHRVICKVLICAILGLDNSHFWQITQDTTAINLIQYRNGKYILSLMNETCHLKALKEKRLGVDF